MSKRIHRGELVFASGDLGKTTELVRDEMKRLADLDANCPGCAQCRPEVSVDVGDRMVALSIEQRLAACLRATLLFHCGHWTDEVAHEWYRLTKGTDASTKGLCNFIRAELAECGYQEWSEPI